MGEAVNAEQLNSGRQTLHALVPAVPKTPAATILFCRLEISKISGKL
jgi:hypothetical protein